MSNPAPDYTIATVVREHVLKVWEISGHNKVQAAKLLGINRRTLYTHLWKYGLFNSRKAWVRW